MRNFKSLFGIVVLVMCAQAVFAQSAKTTTHPAPQATKIAAPARKLIEGPELGRYELYSGIPSMHIGHFILLENGRYKVAFETDEDNYDETGTFALHSDTNTIEWLGGMFRNNNWGGKLVKKDGHIRIEFNPATYGDHK